MDQVFLWLVGHDRLMTHSNIFIWGLIDDPICKGFLRGEEDTSHILRDCKFAREVGTHILIPLYILILVEQ